MLPPRAGRQVPFSAVHLQPSSTLTSSVWVGEEYWQDGHWDVNGVSIGVMSLVGDLGCVTHGVVPERSVVASLAVAEGMPAETAAENSCMVAVGNPASWVQYRAMPGTGEHVAIQGRDLFMQGLVKLLMEVTVMVNSVVGYGAAFGLYSVVSLDGYFHWWALTAFGETVALTYGFLATLLLKHVFIGRFEEGVHGIFSGWSFARQLLLSVYGRWMQRLVYFHSTPVQNAIFRLLGAEVGHRVVIESPSSVLEWDLVAIGDDTIVEEGAILQPHTFENRMMACSHVTIGRQVAVGAGAIVFPGAFVEDFSTVAPLTLVMKDERVRRRPRPAPRRASSGLLQVVFDSFRSLASARESPCRSPPVPLDIDAHPASRQASAGDFDALAHPPRRAGRRRSSAIRFTARFEETAVDLETGMPQKFPSLSKIPYASAL
eukprot:EG_transcript_6998